jgi:hypothetical protein
MWGKKEGWRREEGSSWPHPMAMAPVGRDTMHSGKRRRYLTGPSHQHSRQPPQPPLIHPLSAAHCHIYISHTMPFFRIPLYNVSTMY